MSTKPSWLDDEETASAAGSVAVSVASNPVAQKVASDVAKDPKVQSAVKEAAWSSVTGTTPVAKPVEPAANAPSWASESYTPPGQTAVVVDGGATASSSEFDMDPEELKQMQKWHLALRLFYMAAAAIMGTAAGLSLVNQQNIGLAFFAIYVLFFCLVIFCFEVALDAIAKMIASNFGFLYSIPGRMLFLLFVGFMSFSLSSFGIGAMAVLYAAFLFHLVVVFKFPRFEEYLRKKHFFTRAPTPK